MIPLHRHRRPGTTLIELLIFMGVLAAIGTAVFPLLFSSTEDRLLQQTIALVEQNGIQTLQSIGTRITQAERIYTPSLATSGSVLALRMGSGTLNPTIIGLNSGTLILVEGIDRQELSSSQVAISNLVFRNTSVSSRRQSIEVTFTVSRAIRLQAPRSYRQSFQAVFTLPPDDVLQPSNCSCSLPGCAPNNIFVWEVCQASTCMEAETALTCP